MIRKDSRLTFAKSHITNMEKSINKSSNIINYNLNIPLGKLLFYSSVFLWIAITIFESSNFPNILHLNGIRYISIMFATGSFLISLIEHPFNRTELFLFMFLCALTTTVYFFCNDKQILYILLFVL